MQSGRDSKGRPIPVRRIYAVSALTYIDALKLSRKDLSSIIRLFPETATAVKRYAMRLALLNYCSGHLSEHPDFQKECMDSLGSPNSIGSFDEMTGERMWTDPTSPRLALKTPIVMALDQSPTLGPVSNSGGQEALMQAMMEMKQEIAEGLREVSERQVRLTQEIKSLQSRA